MTQKKPKLPKYVRREITSQIFACIAAVLWMAAVVAVVMSMLTSNDNDQEKPCGCKDK